MTHSNDIVVYLGNTAIAATRSNEMRRSADLIEKRSPATGSEKEYVAGMKSWSVSTSFLVPSLGTALDGLLAVGTTYTLTFGAARQTPTQSSPLVGLQGTAILKECVITASLPNLVQGSFTFQGTGALTNITAQ